MQFPARHPVTVHRSVETVNGFGDPSYGYDDGTEVMSVGWYLTGGSEVGTDGHVYQVDYDAVVMLPVGVDIDPQDRIRLPDGLFDVAMPKESWQYGPWWSPDVERVTLRRAE